MCFLLPYLSDQRIKLSLVCKSWKTFAETHDLNSQGLLLDIKFLRYLKIDISRYLLKHFLPWTILPDWFQKNYITKENIYHYIRWTNTGEYLPVFERLIFGGEINRRANLKFTYLFFDRTDFCPLHYFSLDVYYYLSVLAKKEHFKNYIASLVDRPMRLSSEEERLFRDVLGYQNGF